MIPRSTVHSNTIRLKSFSYSVILLEDIFALIFPIGEKRVQDRTTKFKTWQQETRIPISLKGIIESEIKRYTFDLRILNGAEIRRSVLFSFCNEGTQQGEASHTAKN